MTIREGILSGLRQIPGTIFMILLGIQIYLLINAFMMKRSRRVKALCIVHSLAGFFLMYLLLAVISQEINFPGGMKPSPPLLAAFGRIPASVIAVCVSVSIVLTAVSFADMIRYRRNHLTPDAIKETMDLLPAGVAFFRKDGTVFFRNLTMNRICRLLTGKSLTREDDLRGTVCENTEKLPEEGVQIRLPDSGEVWQLLSRPLTAGREEMVQWTATDITEEAGMTQQLEMKNAKLRELHMRLELYSRQADRIIIGQELLAARMSVHNELGNILLESRHYLQNPASYDEEILLQALKNTNTYLLKEYEEDDTARDPLSEALENAKAIGVKVTVNGIPPTEEPDREILAAAMNECATNTVKHADGDRLWVEITDDPVHSVRVFTFRNNGKPPEEDIRETGGLFSLRTLVKKKQGVMNIQSTPAFSLRIALPKEK